ncbi:helix-turn-helix transcriptional regulator [Aeromicrobium ginsengisoli]|uniref:helix-turn-helix transcriptional regulator n=1 Tax=Aeromicrobium ginsengisoli TaxID=363867 RepID=UPI00165F75EA|nr:helix-turn-helix transcriptional regulator [Aeromicrobium ginsengisoli]
MHLPPSSAALIGRDADLRELDALYAQVVAGEPRAVVVAGEAGIGKSRLLAEFTARNADSARILRGQCVDLGEVATPYAPITAVLRELVDQAGTERVLEAAGPGWDTIGVLLPELGDHVAGGANENRLHEGVALLLEHFARERPVIVVIEDLHWADEATLTVLRFLLRAVASGPIMIVLTYRSDDVHRGHPLRVFLTEIERGRRAKRLELRRLTRAQVRKQAQSILGRTPDFDLVESVFERSEGVPFFVEELLASEDSILPETLRDVLLARYERLDDATQYFLRVVSAGGQRVEHDLVEDVFDGGPEQLDAAARAAVVANVLMVDDSAYTFRHALVREAVHGDLLPGERTRFHGRYAEALAGREKPGDITEIAYHWHAANNHAKAFPAKIAAMRSASQAYAYATAAQMGERALEIWDAIDDAESVAGMPRSKLMGKVAAYLHTAGEPERALGTITLAIALGDVDGPDLARHLMLKAQCLQNTAKLGAIPLLREALELVPPGANESLRATILYRLAARYMIEGAQPNAVDMATQALELAQEISDPEAASVASNIRGVARAHGGDVEGGLADLEQAKDLAEGNSDALLRFRVNYSDMLNLLGRYDESVAVADEGLDRSRELGVERSSGAILASNMIDPLFARGEWERANRLLDRVIALSPPLTFRVYLLRAKVWSTLWRGDLEAAERMFKHWSPHMVALAEVEVQTRLQYVRLAGELALAQDDAAAAWGHLSHVISAEFRSLPGHSVVIYAEAARALARLRADGSTEVDVDDAEKRLREAIDADSFWPNSHHWHAVVDAELGGPTRTGDGVAEWQRALEGAEALLAQTRPYLLLRLGMAQHGAGQRSEAVETLEQAIDAANTLGAGLITNQARTFAQRAGLPLGGAPGRHETGSVELTAREQQVLDLIAEGLTNRQIGERLFISVKTASVHVSAILRKLGASSRTEAAMIAERSTIRV